MVSIPVLNEEHWHELRHKHVGASEIGALFDLHPQITRFELWHRKAGHIPEPDLSDNERVFWGTMLEPAIANGVAKLKGWNVQKVHVYLEHDEVPGMGASLDYKIVAHDKGPGNMEIKTVDWLQFKDWDNGTPPLHYELQVQQQLACSKREWACLPVLIGGNDLRLFEYERRPKTILMLETAVAEFWQSIKDNKEPKPNFLEDSDTIRQLYQEAGGGLVNLSHDNYLVELCARYTAASKEAKVHDDIAEATKAEILTKLGNADKAQANQYTISAAMVASAEIAYTRKAYRNFRITEKKQKDGV